ncbi:MAG TPA: hypothetical protein VH083_04725 [Myxococcales bacterium]|nr:hypothetical protein [Myxococcales bacterium]
MPVERQTILSADDELAREVEGRILQVSAKFESGLRERVTRLLLTAAEAVLKLSDLDLVRHESNEEQGGHTLALWEELAPVMGSTVQHVNELIDDASLEFPPPPEADVEDNLDDAFGPAKQEGNRDDEEELLTRDQEVAKLVSAVCGGMRRDVKGLGERLRNPQVMSDPWMLISDLLEFRGRVRGALGELIYQVASFVAEVDREDVVPGYLAELESGIIVRQATSNLAFLFRGHTKRIGAASDERILPALQDAWKDLHSFSRTRALPALRTSDKRIFLETRATLYRLLKTSPPHVREIKQSVENLARFLDSMSVVSRREALRLHDRAQLAKVGRHMELAQSNLLQPEAARNELGAGLQAAMRLYGRDVQLDAYLRGQRHFPSEWLSDTEIPYEVERVAGLLAGIAPP